MAFLRWHRETLELKCGGLGPADLARRAVGRSALSLLGLVRPARTARAGRGPRG
ncbi:DUF664 domain-containing protein [Nonomuraea insulae]|uniref:DUF664 domain-containing protein n=1 Tax=Nonomuraea insulae TaxID=1616787 RepID=A0ABW1CRL6_9ACTN